MTKEVKKIVCDSFPRGSLFNMDFEGLSWVKGICQKLEASCNEYVDTCNKYVNTAGEHLKKIYDEVCDINGPDSDLCLKHDAISEVSNESLVELDEDSFNENLSACNKMEPTVSISKDSCLLTLSSGSQLLSHRVACDGENREPIPPGDTEEKCMETSNTVSLPAGLTSSLRQDYVQLRTSQETISFLGSLRNDHELQIEHNKLEASVQFQDNDISEIFKVREDISSSSPNEVNQNVETEEFEDINLEDCRDDTIEDEIALISHHAAKNMSFKKKLRNVFISRKGFNLANYQYDGIDMGTQNRQMSAASSVPSGVSYPMISSAQDSIESEWELL